MEKSVDGK